MRFHVPIKLPSLANSRLHWRRTATLKKKQRETTRLSMILAMAGTQPSRLLQLTCAPIVVTITRIGPRKLDDDNLTAACKYVRDQIAASIGVDDGSEFYIWRYEQILGKQYGVDVEIKSRC